ncbi:hypothetical protein Pelo_3427 [Pelomyxa schiedti]|nr:hypothetical protein Pelo_3427 [Pelomyxa schiedti]
MAFLRVCRGVGSSHNEGENRRPDDEYGPDDEDEEYYESAWGESSGTDDVHRVSVSSASGWHCRAMLVASPVPDGSRQLVPRPPQPPPNSEQTGRHRAPGGTPHPSWPSVGVTEATANTTTAAESVPSGAPVYDGAAECESTSITRKRSGVAVGCRLCGKYTGRPECTDAHSSSHVAVACGGFAYNLTGNPTESSRCNGEALEPPEEILSLHMRGDSARFNSVCGAYAYISVEKKRSDLGEDLTVEAHTDSMGLYPLFFTSRHINGVDVFIVTSLWECIAGSIETELCVHSILEYLSFGVTLSDNTFLESVSRIPVGSFLHMNASPAGMIPNLVRHTDTAVIPPNSLTTASSCDELCNFSIELHTRIKQAVQDGYSGSNGDLKRASLTGGADTRLLATCLHTHQRQSVAFATHNGNPSDATIAPKVAEALEISDHSIGDHLLPLAASKISSSLLMHGGYGTEFVGMHCFRISPILNQLSNPTCVCQMVQGIIRMPDIASSNKVKPCFCISAISEFSDFVKEIHRENWDFLGHMLIFTRSFLSDVYGGMRKRQFFSEPYRSFFSGLFFPFLDKRVISLLLSTTSQMRSHYKLYSAMYLNCIPPEIRNLPTNNVYISRLAKIPLFRIPKPPVTPEPWPTMRTTTSHNSEPQPTQHPDNSSMSVRDIQDLFLVPIDKPDAFSHLPVEIQSRVHSLLLWYKQRYSRAQQSSHF